MALKFFSIAVVLFLAEIVFLTTKDFDDNKESKQDIDFTDIAFENIHGYLITKEGVSAKIQASKVLKYRDYSQIFDIKTDFLHQNRENSISANSAILKDDIIQLFSNVHYENSDSLQIKSQNLVYNTKTEVASGKTAFRLTSKQGNVEGDSFIYDQKSGTIKAEKIRYTSSQNGIK